VNTYLVIKWIHIVSSVLLVGTGFGTAFCLFFTNRSGSLPAQVVVTRLVVRADAWFTAPAGVVQIASGLWLAHAAGLALDTPWLAAALVLFGVAGACWLPVLWLQWRMHQLAAQALSSGTALPAQYWRLARRWEWLGYPAFVAMLLIYALMVIKPSA
jgi:uncharacterized membrane protein